MHIMQYEMGNQKFWIQIDQHWDLEMDQKIENGDGLIRKPAAQAGHSKNGIAKI